MFNRLQNSILTTFSVTSCIQTISVYLYVLFMTHNSAEVEYASYISTTYIVDFAVTISLFGFNLLILREPERYIKDNIISIFASSLILSCIIYFIWFIASENVPTSNYILCFILIILQYSYQLGTCLLIKFKCNTIAFINAIVNLGFVVSSLSVLANNDTITCQNVLITRIIQLTIFGIICYAYVLRYILPIKQPTISSFIQNFKYAIPIGGGSILGAAILFVDKLILSTQTADDIATYSVARFEIPFVGIFITNLSLVYIPKIQEALKRNDINDVQSAIRNLFRYGWYLNIIVFTLLFCNANYIITTLYSAQYSAASVLFQIISCTYILKIVPYTNIIIALGIERIIIPRLCIEMVIQICASILFLHLWGITGLAISVIFVLVMWSIPYNIHYFKKTTHSTFEELIPYKEMLLFFIKCFVPCFIIVTYANNKFGLVYGVVASIIYIIAVNLKELKYLYKNTR